VYDDPYFQNDLLCCVLLRMLNTVHSFIDNDDDAYAGTMGVCISPCSLPGAGPMFQLGSHDMELGMGIFAHYFVVVLSHMRFSFTQSSPFPQLLPR